MASSPLLLMMCCSDTYGVRIQSSGSFSDFLKLEGQTNIPNSFTYNWPYRLGGLLVSVSYFSLSVTRRPHVPGQTVHFVCHTARLDMIGNTMQAVVLSRKSVVS